MRRLRRNVLWLVLAVVALLAVVVPYAAPAAGRWLLVNDTPQHARAIVILGGSLPFRAMEGAELFRHGWAPEVWLTHGRRSAEEIAMGELGVTGPREADYNAQILQRKGVPASAIRVLPERNRDTADELRNIAKHLRDAGGGRVILVSSKFHTRRLKVLWQKFAADAGEAIVRYTPDDRFDPDRWWRTTGDAMALAREYGSLLNAWAGFPISADR